MLYWGFGLLVLQWLYPYVGGGWTNNILELPQSEGAEEKIEELIQKQEKLNRDQAERAQVTVLHLKETSNLTANFPPIGPYVDSFYKSRCPCICVYGRKSVDIIVTQSMS